MVDVLNGFGFEYDMYAKGRNGTFDILNSAVERFSKVLFAH